MIPVAFTTPIPALIADLPARLASHGIPEPVVRRRTPSPRPHRFVLLRDDGGPRAEDVHRLVRVGVQVWATYPNGDTDWDGLAVLAKWTQFEMENAKAFIPQISAATQSNGSYPVVDESGTEYRYFTLEYLMRGEAA